MYSIVIENTMIIVHLKYIYNAPPIFFQFSNPIANPFAPPLTSNPGSALALSHQGGVRTATARRTRKTQNAEARAVRSPRAPRDRRGIAVASPLDAVGSPKTPCHGAHFVHAQSARRGSAFPRRSEWAPCERSGFAAAAQ